MKKKGFTLVELLAVIAILAILVIIALPNVMGMFNQAKLNSFTTELKDIYNAAVQKNIADSYQETKERVYARLDSSQDVNGSVTVKELDLSGRKTLRYCIIFNKAGKVTTYVATDGSYIYGYTGDGLEIENIVTPDEGTSLPSDYTMDGYVYSIADFEALDGKITLSNTSGSVEAKIALDNGE
jgi:type IV pilus assembly protein PilA